MNQLSNIINDRVDDMSDNLSSISTFAQMQTDEQNDNLENKPVENYLLQTDEESEIDKTENKKIDIDQIKNTIYSMKDQLDGILRLLDGKTNKKTSLTAFTDESTILETGEKIVEGVFNGEKMIGADGQEYSMSPNYASKSKIVEGDLMKVTITKEGRFIFKQIGPVERKRVIGKLLFDEEGQIWTALHEEKNYKILPASVTFYKGKPGDEIVILISQGNPCDWGAVENIISH